MAIDVKGLEEAVKRLRARFKTSVFRSIVGLVVGIVSPFPPALLGPGVGCSLSLTIGLAVYLATAVAVRRLWGGLLTERQIYTTGILGYFAAWGVGFIVASQAVFSPPSSS